MYYSFGSNSGGSISDMVDSKELAKILEERYSTSKMGDLEAQSKEVKKIIKNKNEFKRLVEDTKIDPSEIIRSLVHLYPNMFNYNMIKFVKENYLKDE